MKKKPKARRSLPFIQPSLLSIVFLFNAACSSDATGEPDAAADSGSDSGSDSGQNCDSVAPPRLISPLSTKMIASGRPTFKWEGETSITYTLEVSPSYSFDVIEYSWTGTGTSHQVSVDLEKGAHFWRVYVASCQEETVTPIWEMFAGMVPSDVNGDGFSDLVVGTWTGNDVLVFLGSNSIFGQLSVDDADVALHDEAYWGASCSSWGDINGDNISDIAIGNNSNYCPGGAVIICYGRESWLSTIPSTSCQAIVHYDSDETCSGLGEGLSTSMDIDIDGVFDLVGSDMADSSYEQLSGTAWIFLSDQGPLASRTSTDQANIRVEGTDYHQGLGGDSFSEDMNGDGRPELLFTTARTPSVGFDWAGEAYLLMGKEEIPSELTSDDLDTRFTAEGEDVGFWAGDAIGDFNGDGYGDLVVGYRGGPGDHWVVVVGGQEELPLVVDFDSPAIITKILHPGGLAADGYSIGMMGPGDINGDGYDDLVFTMYGADTANPTFYDPLGAIFIIYGGTGVPVEISAENADVIIVGNGDPAFANSWGPVGDINADGYADFAVAATGDGPNPYDEFPGRVFVFYGGPTLEEKETADDADLIITSNTPNESFGFCINEERGF